MTERMGDRPALEGRGETLAIVDAAKNGEHNEAKLTAFALAHYAKYRASIRERELLWRVAASDGEHIK